MATTARTDPFVRGAEEAIRQYKASPHKDDAYAALDLVNPYQRDTEEWEGFERVLYDLIQQ